MSKPMIAIKPHRYAGRMYAVGDRYSVQGEDHRKLYKALGWAADAPPPEPYRAKLFAAPFKAAEADAKPKRTYMTRRLLAGDSAKTSE